jgi:hypothetical protein
MKNWTPCNVHFWFWTGRMLHGKYQFQCRNCGRVTYRQSL